MMFSDVRWHMEKVINGSCCTAANVTMCWMYWLMSSVKEEEDVSYNDVFAVAEYQSPLSLLHLFLDELKIVDCLTSLNAGCSKIKFLCKFVCVVSKWCVFRVRVLASAVASNFKAFIYCLVWVPLTLDIEKQLASCAFFGTYFYFRTRTCTKAYGVTVSNVFHLESSRDVLKSGGVNPIIIVFLFFKSLVLVFT